MSISCSRKCSKGCLQYQLEAGHERGRMPHQNDDLEIEVPRKPVAGERRDWILDNQAATSERREPVLWLVLEEDLPCAPTEDLVEGFQGRCKEEPGAPWRLPSPCVGRRSGLRSSPHLLGQAHLEDALSTLHTYATSRSYRPPRKRGTYHSQSLPPPHMALPTPLEIY